LPHLAKNLARLLLLPRSQVLPSLHAVEYAQLLVGRQIGELMQLLKALLLLLRGQPAEVWIIPE